MAEATLTTVAPPDAEQLAHDVAVLAGRLADLLGEASIAREEALAPGVAFLRSIAADANIDGAFSDEVRHPIDRVAEAYGLARVEMDLLLLAGMAEEHEGFASLFRTLHPRGEPRPTAGLAAQLLCDSPRERWMLRDLLTTGAAVRSGALALGDEGPFFERSLLLAEGLWPVLAGADVWPTSVHPLDRHDDHLGLDEWLATERVARATTALRRALPTLVVVMADDDLTATYRALAMAAHARVKAVAVECAANAATIEVQRLIALHAVARGAIPIVRIAAAADGHATDAPTFHDAPVPVMLCARDGTFVVRGTRPVFTVPVERLSVRHRMRLWRAMLPELHDEAPSLAMRYAIEPHAIRDVAADVRERASVDGRAPMRDDVADSVRARANLALTGGVRVVHPTAGWDRLVLPDDRQRQLREALDRLLHQGRVLDDWGFLAGRAGARGVRMLFAGPSGTGKTLAAEVLAHTVGVDLLVVDLARVVSKWIGETEKNLSDVFDAAERTQSVLFFDEADALFGKRTAVNDAHDRYANLETAYLLARLERFDGLAILSTNLRENIDSAFTRRLEFVVDFDEPSVDERIAIWQCHLPATAPLAADVRVDELASLYPIVGGLIRNASVAAGFLASAADAPITRTDLVRAVKREYEKSGRAFPGAPAGTFTS